MEALQLDCYTCLSSSIVIDYSRYGNETLQAALLQAEKMIAGAEVGRCIVRNLSKVAKVTS